MAVLRVIVNLDLLVMVLPAVVGINLLLHTFVKGLIFANASSMCIW